MTFYKINYRGHPMAHQFLQREVDSIETARKTIKRNLCNIPALEGATIIEVCWTEKVIEDLPSPFRVSKQKE